MSMVTTQNGVQYHKDVRFYVVGLAFSEILSTTSGSRGVVLDTAPNGHGPLTVDAPKR